MAARLTAYLVVAIVAATLIAGLIVGAQRDDSDGPVDLIVRNATLYTADRRGSMAEAVAIRGNQVLRVGSNREIDRLQRPQTTVIDARGGSVLPGFNDANVDLIAGGLRRLNVVDLTAASSADEILERIAAWAATHPSAPWIVGNGWSAKHFRNGLPTRQMLDEIVRDRPVVIAGTDTPAHPLWANSKALQVIGLSRTSELSDERMMVRDPRTREPIGIITGDVATMLLKHVPEPTAEQRAAALESAIAEANAAGVTSAQVARGCHQGDAERMDAARREGTLTIRVYCPEWLAPGTIIENEKHLAAYEGFRQKYPDDPFLKSGGLALDLDGDIGDHTAALLEPYEPSGRTETGRAYFHPDDLNRIARLADAAGWQIITHATGDRAVRMGLTAYAHAVRSNRPPSRGRRHRLDGLALVDSEDVSRFGPLGVLAAVQPLARSATAEDLRSLTEELGAARAQRTYPMAEIADGTRLILGSGWPTHPLDPLRALDRVVNPPALGDSELAPVEPLPLKAAIDAYTSTSAWASFDDQRKGSISAGMLADLVVLSDDIFASPAKLSAASVSVTIFDGKIVYQRVPRSETVPAPSLQH